MSYRATTVRNVSFPSGSTVAFDQAVGTSPLTTGYATIYPQSALNNTLLRSLQGVDIVITAIPGGSATATILSNPSGRTIRATDICEMSDLSISSLTPPVGIGYDSWLITFSTLVVVHAGEDSHVTADFVYNGTGTLTDSGAIRGIGTQLDGDGAVRGVEAHGVRYAAAGAGFTAGAEIGSHAATAGLVTIAGYLSTSYNIGALITSDENFLAPGTGVRADTGVFISGGLGWNYGILYTDTNGASVLFELDRFGNVVSRAPAGTIASHKIVSAGAAGAALILESAGGSNSWQTDSAGNGTYNADAVAAGVIVVEHAASVATTMYIKAGKVGLGMVPTKQLELSTDNAQKPTTNTWTITSDARTKDVEGLFSDGLDVLRQLEPKWFTFNGLANTEKGRRFMGFVAQDIADVAPYMVERSMGRLYPQDDDDPEVELLSYQGHALPFILINAIKELARDVAELKEKVA